MKLIDNLERKLVDDLRVTMQRDSRDFHCGSVLRCMRMRAENLAGKHRGAALSVHLPDFLQEKTAKARREFYIPRRNRRKSPARQRI